MEGRSPCPEPVPVHAPVLPTLPLELSAEAPDTSPGSRASTSGRGPRKARPGKPPDAAQNPDRSESKLTRAPSLGPGPRPERERVRFLRAQRRGSVEEVRDKPLRQIPPGSNGPDRTGKPSWGRKRSLGRCPGSVINSGTALLPSRDSLHKGSDAPWDITGLRRRGTLSIHPLHGEGRPLLPGPGGG